MRAPKDFTVVPSIISFCGLYLYCSPSIINTSITICSRSIDTRRWHDGSHFDGTGETNSTSGSCIIDGACANVPHHNCHQCVWPFNRPYDILVAASGGPTPSALSTRPSWRSSRLQCLAVPLPFALRMVQRGWWWNGMRGGAIGGFS